YFGHVFVATKDASTNSGGGMSDFLDEFAEDNPLVEQQPPYPADRGMSGIAVEAALPLVGSCSIGSPPATACAPSVWVTNSTDNSVSQLWCGYYDDTGHLLGDLSCGLSQTYTIPVGNQPNAIAADSPSDLIYVANTGDSTVSVIRGVHNCA